MPPSRSAALSARIAVLGIVVQGDGPQTLGNVALRLAEDFGAARFPKNTVHQNLRNLTTGGYLRLVREGAEPSYSLYEAQDKGVEEFMEWLVASEPAPPALRDALQARLSFYTRAVERGDIAGLVEKLRAQQQHCARQFAVAHGNVHLEQAQRREQPGSLNDALYLIRMEDEAELWGNAVERLQKLRVRLERLLSGDRVVR